jgi:type I restriction enzyme M protein
LQFSWICNIFNDNGSLFPPISRSAPLRGPLYYIFPEMNMEKQYGATKEFSKDDQKTIFPTTDEIARNDFTISPSRYIHTGEADEYRPIAKIVEELNSLEEGAKATDAPLKDILKKIGA